MSLGSAITIVVMSIASGIIALAFYLFYSGPQFISEFLKKRFSIEQTRTSNIGIFFFSGISVHNLRRILYYIWRIGKLHVSIVLNFKSTLNCVTLSDRRERRVSRPAGGDSSVARKAPSE